MQLAGKVLICIGQALFTVGKGCPEVVTDFMGDPGSQNSYSVNPRSELALFPHLYVFESPSSLYVSVSFPRGCWRGAHPFYLCAV